jgi:hypothetical protein
VCHSKPTPGARWAFRRRSSEPLPQVRPAKTATVSRKSAIRQTLSGESTDTHNVRISSYVIHPVTQCAGEDGGGLGVLALVGHRGVMAESFLVATLKPRGWPAFPALRNRQLIAN